MFKSQLAISLGVLLSYSGSTSARFLQSSTNSTQPTSAPVISPAPQTTTIPYSANLLCGECILGGYVFCINGPEGYSGSSKLQTNCCQKKATCPQISKKLWTCSSKYDNMTVVDKLRVCPYDQNQCGNKNLNFNDFGDSQCLRLKKIQKGSACLYNIKSKCGVPKFQVNDTSDIYTSALLVSNKTIAVSSVPTTPVDKCSVPKDQACICRHLSANGSTKYVCDCETTFNAELNSAQCPRCVDLRDNLGNIIKQCTCTIPQPIQAYEDQACTCRRVTDLKTKATSLSCTCAKPVPARNVSFPEDQCKCLNNYNPTTQQAYLDCICLNVPTCQDPMAMITTPPKVVPAPCSTSYPCQCSAIAPASPQNVTGNATSNSTVVSPPSSDLQCTCLNPSTNSSALINNPAAQCSCQRKISSATTWFQDCKCCLQEEVVRQRLIPPITCDKNSMKQACSCLNVTVNSTGKVTYGQSCNCSNPLNNAVASNIVYNNAGCDCQTTALGTKNCSCCVSADVQAAQSQPSCAAPLDSCNCAIDSTGKPTCDCFSNKYNATFTQTALSPKDCYCRLDSTNSMKPCNCCVSESAYSKSKLTCPSNTATTACKCEVIPATNKTASSYSCDCQNRFFFNQVTPKIQLAPSTCSCFGSDCQCCTTEKDLVVIPTQCNAGESLISCKQCGNVMNPLTKKLQYACNCTANLPNATLPVTLPNYAVNNTSCGCVNSADRTTCDCCVSDNTVQNLRPVCTSDSISEKCSCRNNNVSVPMNRTVFFNVTKAVNLTCRRTGYNGQLCQQDVNRTVIPWDNAHACYSTVAGTVCDFQASTNACGWTVTPALTACLAKPAVIKTPQTYQNQTYNATSASRLVNKTETQSRVESYVEIQTRFQCNCKNTRYPAVALNNVPGVTPALCGCDKSVNSSQTACDCCVPKKTEDEVFLGSLTCKAVNTTLSQCSCDANNTCSCAAPNSNVFYKDLKVAASNCNCVSTSGSALRQCNCCISSQSTALIPAFPVCSSIQTPLSGCVCDSSSSPALKCACRAGTANRTEYYNVTVNSTVTNSTSNTTTVIQVPKTYNRTVVETVWINQTLDASQCGCLNAATIANPNKVNSVCNCCAYKPFTCNALTTADTQNCDCKNVTVKVGKVKSWQWSCNCVRKDNNVRRDFNFSNTNDCGYNPTIGAFQCCITKGMYDLQVPVLTCNATSDQKQNCQCTKDSLCNCTRNDNGIVKSFKFGSNSCLCGASSVNSTLTSCQCCVSQPQLDTQVPSKTCSAEGPNYVPQYCSCKNVTSAAKPAVRTVPPLNCNCSRPEFGIVRNWNFTQSSCLCLGNSRCECCLSPQQQAEQIPTLQCAASDLAQTNCSCTNTTVNGKPQQTCSCKFPYQKKEYTANGLTTQANNCMCNGTTCGCCLNNQVVELFTDRYCASTETKSKCSACILGTDAKTKKNNYNCSACSLFTPQYTLNNQSFNGIDENSCICRGDNGTTNCSCCVTGATTVPAAPICAAPTPVSLPNCQCVTGLNGTQVCNCIQSKGAVETYFNNLTTSGCNCLSVTNAKGVSFQQCACCASAAQVSFVPPTCKNVSEASIEECQCDSVVDSKGAKYLNCQCNYKNLLKIKDLAYPEGQCSCLSTNTLTKPCGCCVSAQTYRDAVNPQCGANTIQGLCSTQVISKTDAKTKLTTTTLIGNCTADTKNGIYSNANMTLDPTLCSCYNDTRTGAYMCKCCMNGTQDIIKLPERQCNALSQLNATCSCPPFTANTTACACDVRQGPYTYNLPQVRLNNSHCSCFSVMKNNVEVQACSCCAPRALINHSAPVCNPALSNNQNCSCQSVFNKVSNTTQYLCDCKDKTNKTKKDLDMLPSQCNCLRQNFNGVNSLNCSCCVANPPPSLCERLNTSSDALRCNCRDIVLNGKATFTCDCASRINATKSITRSNLILDEASQCCCQEVIDKVTKKGSKICNCTQPTVKQTLNCQCKAPSANSTSSDLTCVCNDCNSVATTRVLPQASCSCPLFNSSAFPIKQFNTTVSNSTKTNSTTNATTTTNSTVPKVNSTTNTTVAPTNSTTKTNATTNTTVSPATNTTKSNATTNSTAAPANTTKSNSTTNSSSATNTTKTNGTAPAANSTSNSTRTNSTSNSTSANSTGSQNQTKTNSSTATNSSSNSTTNPPVVTPPSSYSCSCQIDFAGFCPEVDIAKNSTVDEDSCDASNRPKPALQTLPSANCTQEYEYIVAVVAKNKDSSVLMQLQSYQMQSGSYLKVALLSMLLALSYIFF